MICTLFGTVFIINNVYLFLIKKNYQLFCFKKQLNFKQEKTFIPAKTLFRLHKAVVDLKN